MAGEKEKSVFQKNKKKNDSSTMHSRPSIGHDGGTPLLKHLPQGLQLLGIDSQEFQTLGKSIQ